MGKMSQSPGPERAHRARPLGLGGGAGASATVAVGYRTREGLAAEKQGRRGTCTPLSAKTNTSQAFPRSDPEHPTPGGAELSVDPVLSRRDSFPGLHPPKVWLCENGGTAAAPQALPPAEQSQPRQASCGLPEHAQCSSGHCSLFPSLGRDCGAEADIGERGEGQRQSF